MNPILDAVVGGLIGTVGKVADDLFTSDEERMRAELDSYNAETGRLQGQVDINKIEAAHTSLLVAGWRPFIGWICGIAFAYAAIFEPLMRFVSAVSFGYSGEFPTINTELTLQILLGILGLGAMRSFDKKQKGLSGG